MDKATETFHFSPLLIAVVFVVAAFLLIAGLRLRRTGRHSKLAWALIVFGVVAGSLFGPGLINDRITITGHSYSSRTGFWFAPNRSEFEFKDVEVITVGHRRDSKGRTHRRWNVHLMDGSVLEVPNGDLWRMNEKRIVELLSARGVRLQ